MRKVDVWPLLTAESRAAALKSQELYAALGELPSHPVAAARAGYVQERRFWNAFPAEVARVEELSHDTGHGTVRLRFYHPAPGKALPVILYLHGGGYILGNLDTHDRVQRLHARESGWALLAIDYTLAPEARFPTQVLQAASVARSLATLLAGRDVDTARFAFAGDSAGANLSCATTFELAATGGPRPEALLLYYGGYGLKDSPSRRLYGNQWDGLEEKELGFYRSTYLADEAQAGDPRYDILRGDLALLPRSFVLACALDPLHDDSVALARGLALAGVAHELTVYEGVLHSFLHYSGLEPRALRAIREGAAFLGRP
jgi:acetyl esterase